MIYSRIHAKHQQYSSVNYLMLVCMFQMCCSVDIVHYSYYMTDILPLTCTSHIAHYCANDSKSWFPDDGC